MATVATDTTNVPPELLIIETARDAEEYQRARGRTEVACEPAPNGDFYCEYNDPDGSWVDCVMRGDFRNYHGSPTYNPQWAADAAATADGHEWCEYDPGSD